MGYYVNLMVSNATLPADHLDEAMARLLELNTHDEWKHGVSYVGGEVTERHFSWMDPNYDTKYTTVEEILEAVGYDVDVLDDDNSLVVTSYYNKTGCEAIFIWYISDLFEPGSYMEWTGEDGEQERWEFGGGEKMTVSLRRGWSEPVSYQPGQY